MRLVLFKFIVVYLKGKFVCRSKRISMKEQGQARLCLHPVLETFLLLGYVASDVGATTEQQCMND